jgi:hypothetical protein
MTEIPTSQPMPPVPSNPIAAGGNYVMGILYGVAAAAAIGLVWYLVVAFTNRQFVVLALAMGAIPGAAVAIGSKRTGVVSGVLAAVIALIGILVSYYFIDRHIIVEGLGSGAKVPLWDSFEFARELVKAGFDADKSQYLFTFAAIVVAGWVGFNGLNNRN